MGAILFYLFGAKLCIVVFAVVEMAAAAVGAARFCSLIVAMEVERRRVRVENIMIASAVMA